MQKKMKSEAVLDDAGDSPDKTARGKMGRRMFLKGALATAPLLIAGPTILTPRKSYADDNFRSIGPSTTTEPYMIPSVPGVKLVSILTVGDVIDGYRMVGIPDGLGAFNSDWDKFTVYNESRISRHGRHRPKARLEGRLRLSLDHRSAVAQSVQGTRLHRITK